MSNNFISHFRETFVDTNYDILKTTETEKKKKEKKKENEISEICEI